MYSIVVPAAQWFTCRMWLEQNYFVNRRDYTFVYIGVDVEVTLLHADLYERFKQRFANP